MKTYLLSVLSIILFASLAVYLGHFIIWLWRLAHLPEWTALAAIILAGAAVITRSLRSKP